MRLGFTDAPLEFHVNAINYNGQKKTCRTMLNTDFYEDQLCPSVPSAHAAQLYVVVHRQM